MASEQEDCRAGAGGVGRENPGSMYPHHGLGETRDVVVLHRDVFLNTVID